MSTTKAKSKGKKAPTVDEAAPPMLVVRGLTFADHEGLERAAARRNALVGGYVSKNTAALSLLRSAIAAEDAADAAREVKP